MRMAGSTGLEFKYDLMDVLKKAIENILGILCLLVLFSGCGTSSDNSDDPVPAADSLANSTHTVEQIWETGPVLAHPECVLIDSNTLYISLIDGGPYDMDGKGGIAKLDRNGNIVDANWVTGLDAPKGMGIWNGRLYVTDMSKIVALNLSTGKIESVIPIPGTTGLNDIAFDSTGVMYVSDVRLGRIYRITNGVVETHLTDLAGANGLKVVNENLYVLTNSGLYSIAPDKQLTLETRLEPGGDGIQPAGNEEFLISRYTGILYHLDKNRTLQTLLDTREQMISAADFDYDAVQRVIYVPTLANNTVAAYRLR